MITVPKSAKHITELPRCWIQKGEQYRLHTQSKGNNLPIIRISPKNERILNRLGAGYRRITMAHGDMYEFWDKDFYETETLTLPTYVFLFNEYRYIGNNTFENPTKETINKAFELDSKIKECLMIDEESLQKYEGEMEEILREILDGNESKYVFSQSFKEDEEYETENEHFYVFVLKTRTGKLTGHVLIFDRRKIKDTVRVEVPAADFRYICGKEGSNVKRWSKKMGIKKIKLKEMK